jgi:diguanylate cyclase (GGDEF)-like protein
VLKVGRRRADQGNVKISVHSRLVRSALVTVAVLVPTVALSSTGTASAATDVADSVRTLAERAAQVTVEERTLLELASDTEVGSAEWAGLTARLDAVDAHGAELLDQLTSLDVALTEAIRIGLGLLAPAADRAARPEVYVPSAAVYETATTDLLRIAATPEAVTSTPGTSDSPRFGLLAVAALSLLALGAAALGNSLRRRPDADELAAMAWSDGLTGLANRRRLDVDIARHDTDVRPTAAIMVDIDHFKEINDTFGHAYGDDVLRRVGATLSKQVRFDDVVYRYGGEEFCVLLPGATVDEAGGVADRIVNAVRSITLPDGRNVTVSVGVSDADRADAAGALHLADRALYAAKQGGRDRAIARL